MVNGYNGLHSHSDVLQNLSGVLQNLSEHVTRQEHAR